MARAKSHLMSSIRGSVGGLTYLANNFQSIVMRARVSPIQPNTTPQTVVKNALNAGSAQYNAQTDQVKTDWETYAQSLVYEGPLGTYTVPGRSVAMGQYSFSEILVAAGVPGFSGPSMVAPTVAGFLSVGNIETAAPNATGIGFNLKVTNPNDEACHVTWELSLQQSASRFRFKGPWRPQTLDGVSAPANTSIDQDVVGLTDGGVYFVRIRLISTAAPRRLSAVSIIRIVAEETV